uniref:hypothetical protein n=1 Tax=Methanobrevibacter smithii TaxID=2173 RepID=UPI00384C2583
ELANKTEGPVIIEIKTKIGFGAPNEGTNAVHGAPIGEENAKLLRDALDYHNEPFVVDKSVYDFFLHSVKERGVIAEVKWSHLFDGYAHDYPELCAEYEKFNYNSYEINKAKHPTWEVGQIESTRKIVGKLIDFYSIICLYFGGFLSYKLLIIIFFHFFSKKVILFYQKVFIILSYYI